MMYQIWLAIHFNGLCRYAPLQLTGETLLCDKDQAPTRSSNVEYTGLASGETVAEKEKVLEIAGKIYAPREQTEQTEQASRSLSLAEKQRRSSLQSLSTAHLSRRGTDMEAQKEHDKHQAKRILERLHRPLDEAQLAKLESDLSRAEAYVSNSLIPRKREVTALMMNDPISRIIMQHNDDLEALTAEERDMLVS